MESTCIMTFGTAGGKSVNVRVPRAKPDMTAMDVRAAMNQILSAAAIKTADGKIVSIEKATVQTVATRVYDVR